MNITAPNYDVSDNGAKLLLFEFGISERTLLSPPTIREGRVHFLERSSFEFTDDDVGVRAFIFVEPKGELIAWRPGHPIASLYGRSFALNEEAISNPATWFGDRALRVHRSPLEWLLADRDGIVIVQPECTYFELRHAAERGLSFADHLLKQQVKRWLEPPRIKPKLYMEVVERSAA
jgi:hypothetical protein